MKINTLMTNTLTDQVTINNNVNVKQLDINNIIDTLSLQCAYDVVEFSTLGAGAYFKINCPGIMMIEGLAYPSDMPNVEMIDKKCRELAASVEITYSMF